MALDLNQLYLEIPEVILPEQFYTATEPFMTPQQKQAMDFMSGTNLDASGNTNFIITTKESTWETATVHPDTAKGLASWCRKTFNLKFSGVFFVRTKPNSVGPWHCEGPLMKGRQCALNFLIAGESGKTKAQWGVHKTIDTPPEEIEKYFSGAVPPEDVDIIGEYISKMHVPFFYNTACLHRSFNTSSTAHRTLLSVCLSDNIGISHVRAMYEKGTLFK